MVKKMPKNSKSRGATLSREAGLCIPRQLGRSPGQQQYREELLTSYLTKKKYSPPQITRALYELGSALER
jgi:hypothetical protein